VRSRQAEKARLLSTKVLDLPLIKALTRRAPRYRWTILFRADIKALSALPFFYDSTMYMLALVGPAEIARSSFCKLSEITDL